MLGSLLHHDKMPDIKLKRMKDIWWVSSSFPFSSIQTPILSCGSIHTQARYPLLADLLWKPTGVLS
jgi:hypothetical protein